MADTFIPATFVGLTVSDESQPKLADPHTPPPAPSTEEMETGAYEVPLAPRVRFLLEAKKSDWQDVQELQGLPGVTVLPNGDGVLLDPVAAIIVLKGEEPEGKPA